MENPAIGVSADRLIDIPAHYLTRHGLIAGSTGTGKSRAMQVLAEQLAEGGSNVFVSDIKGDASGFCIQGKQHPRNKSAPFEMHALKANYWSISDRFARLRFSLSACGSILISRLLSLNPTQESHLTLAFSYARKNGLPLDDLDQLLDILDELVKKEARGVSKPSVNVIERNILALQESGIGNLFGKPAVELADLEGLNVLNLSDSRKNMVASIAPAFLLQILFDSLPEVGDVEQPKYVVFFDEAHYLFKDSNKSLQDRMITILKQIRSKGVSVFFVTQDVTDLPDEILSQLSTKIIFSQKVFTQKGNRRLNALAKSFPESDINVLERLKSVPTGTAIVSSLDEKGNQTPPSEVTMFAPATTMEVVEDEVLRKATDPSLLKKYSQKNVVQKTKPLPQKKKIKPEVLREIKKEFSPPHLPFPDPPKKKSSGPSIWDGIFRFLLKLLDFILKFTGKLLNAILFKPLKAFFKYLVKKPVRILYFLLFLLLLYVIYVNWEIIQAFLDSLDFS